MVELLNQHQHIYLLDGVLSDIECEYLQKVTDKYQIAEEKHGHQSNVQSKTIGVLDIPYEKTRVRVVEMLQKITKDIFSKHNIGMAKVAEMETPLLRKITGATRLHVDGLLTDIHVDTKTKTLDIYKIRELSMIIALNSDYDGGELCFPEQKFEVKLKKGQALLFPPYWTHPHKTNELKNNTVRYTITTWMTLRHPY